MYIFLDVDGVLNKEADWAKKAYSLDSHCAACFCKLLNSLPDPKVVLSSTWRNGIARDGTTAVHIDDPNIFDQKEKTPHLYITSAKTGLTDADVAKILKLIKRRI